MGGDLPALQAVRETGAPGESLPRRRGIAQQEQGRTVAREILIRFDWQGGDRGRLVHIMRNFGEALFTALRNDNWATIDIAEVDRATDRLRVAVRSARRLRRTRALIEKLLKEHFLSGYATITVSALPQ